MRAAASHRGSMRAVSHEERDGMFEASKGEKGERLPPERNCKKERTFFLRLKAAVFSSLSCGNLVDLHGSRLRHHRRARAKAVTTDISLFSGWRRDRVCVPGLARDRKPASPKESPAGCTGATPSSEHKVRLLQPDMTGGGPAPYTGALLADLLGQLLELYQ